MTNSTIDVEGPWLVPSAIERQTAHPAVEGLRSRAEKAAKAPIHSVVDKDVEPPSGDPHDYVSQGPYWWPNPDTDDGLPYVRRDGETNPETETLDRQALGAFAEDVWILAFAAYYLEEPRWATPARKRLQTWFIDDATAMNPHLKFGQRIPGRCSGRGIGIIDTVQFRKVVDAIAFLWKEGLLSDRMLSALRGWFGAYLNWLLESDFGRDERAMKNNHGTWYDVQVLLFGAFLGRDAFVRRYVEFSPGERRLSTQFDEGGIQPYEYDRTRPLSYSTFNLEAHLHLARLYETVGIDLYAYETPHGTSIEAGVEWLVEAISERTRDPEESGSLKPLNQARVFRVLRRGAIVYDNANAEAAIDQLEEIGPSSDPFSLLYPPIHR